ncbi:glutathione peroxidase [Candidatus Saccharibacteria bacterium]|nr:glutathione peroxidase [Candidatus Saccharibacteria bacterium]
MGTIYDFTVKTAEGKDLALADFKGKVMLIVNTATGCGFTPQYEGLEKLYEKYHDAGLEVLDFPCNQFGHQAPGTIEEIRNFCQLKYDTKFDQLAKVEVNGDKTEPLFAFLKEAQPEDPEPKGMKNRIAMTTISKLPGVSKEKGFIKWNFTKFLVDREGNVVRRFGPTDKPEEIEAEIEKVI